jgi:hypothetical protein
VAFIVEDGTGLPNSNSLASVEYADAYFMDRGNETWLDPEVDQQMKERALVEATDYIMYVWEPYMKGHRQFPGQALPFPRLETGFEPMPDLILRTTSEYAVRALVRPLMPDITQDASGKTVTSEMKKLDVLQKQVSYSEWKEVETQKSYGIPDNMIKPFLDNNSGATFLTRG